MHVGSREVEGVGAQLGHGIAVHVHLVLLVAIDAELVAPCIGSDVLAEAYLFQHLVVGQRLVVHQVDGVGQHYLGELCLIDGLVAKLGDAFGQVERRDVGKVEGIVADGSHVVANALYRHRGRYRHLSAVGRLVRRRGLLRVGISHSQRVVVGEHVLDAIHRHVLVGNLAVVMRDREVGALCPVVDAQLLGKRAVGELCRSHLCDIRHLFRCC